MKNAGSSTLFHNNSQLHLLPGFSQTSFIFLISVGSFVSIHSFNNKQSLLSKNLQSEEGIKSRQIDNWSTMCCSDKKEQSLVAHETKPRILLCQGLCGKHNHFQKTSDSVADAMTIHGSLLRFLSQCVTIARCCIWFSFNSKQALYICNLLLNRIKKIFFEKKGDRETDKQTKEEEEC